jgi:anti-anti-sigma factor
VAVLVPEALAYATIAGVSPVVGLYAAPGALLLYAAFGSSRHLVTGPMAATAALSAAAVADLATAGSDDFLQLTITLALVTGILALLAGVFRLGFLASFISEPVLKGFIIGLALTIIVGQVPKLLGIEKTEGDFFEQLWDLLGNLGDTSGLTLLVGGLSLVLVVGLKEVAPVVPGSLVAVLAGILAVQLFGLDEHGVAIVGEVESGLPSFGLPDTGLSDYLDLAPAAVGIMLVGFAEGLGAAKTYAAKHHYEVDPNRELLGLGTANLVSGLSSGMVVNGSLSKTAVNGAAGARSQLSGLVVAALTVVTLLFLTGLFEQLPEATLAAVVIAALVELVDVARSSASIASTRAPSEPCTASPACPTSSPRWPPSSACWSSTRSPASFIGVIVSLLLLLYRVSRPHVAVLGHVPGTRSQYGDVERHPENEVVPGVVVLRVEGGLFFGNADAVKDRVQAALEPDTKAVVLDAETIPYVDVTAVGMLSQLVEELEAKGVRLALAGDIGQVRDVIGRAGGDVSAYPTVREAVEALADASR